MTNAATAAKQFLIDSQNADGGWGYIPSNSSTPEPTIYAAMALWGDEGKPKRAARRALDLLASQCITTGALRLERHPEDHWATLLYLLALSKLNQDSTLKDRVTGWSLKSESFPVNEVQDIDIDGKLVGWAWAKATFGWVEPTSYGLLALKSAGKGAHIRVRQGTRLLLDRVCDDGGWNYGNRAVLGQHLTSYLPTTALATMALQGDDTTRDIVEKGLDFLIREIDHNLSTLNLALTVLCLDVYGRDTDKYKEALKSRQSPDGSWTGNVQLTALATLSLDTTDKARINAGGMGNIFRV